MGKIDFKVSIDEQSIRHKLKSLYEDEPTMTEIHNLFAKTVDPWVPFLEGPLSQTFEVTPKYVRYIQPYAHYQYMGLEFNHTKDYHPLASAMWDKESMKIKQDQFENDVKKILMRRAKQLYG